MENNKLHVPFLILAVGMIISVTVFSVTWKAARSSDQTINVTGSAKQPIVSDYAIIKGTLKANSRTAKSAYSELQKQIPILMEYLKSKGLNEDNIELKSINSYPIKKLNDKGFQTQQVLSYNYSQQIEISSDDVYKIKDLSIEINSIVNKGVNLSVNVTEYHYTKLDELKVEIQADAAKNAMKRAEKIAEATDRDLGPLRRARMGVIQIRPIHSTQVSNYGYNDVTSINKEIMAVVNASFEID